MTRGYLWRLKNPERGRRLVGRTRRQLVYGITPERFDKMLIAQAGLCAICSKAEPLQVDHDHTTGKIRGLLCLLCNRDIGALERLRELLPSVLAYLENRQAV